MPGTMMRDALAANLATGATLNAAGSTNGTAVAIGKPGLCRCFIATSTVTGTTPTIQVTLQVADDLAFTVNVRKVAASPASSGTGAAQTSVNYVFNAPIWANFVRAIVTVGGTTPVYTGTTITLRALHDRETHTQDIAAN